MEFIHFPVVALQVDYWCWPTDEPEDPYQDFPMDFTEALEAAPVVQLPSLQPGGSLASARHGLRHRTEDGDWLVGGRLERTKDRWVLTEIRMCRWPWPTKPPTRLQTKALQSVSLPTLADTAAQLLASNSAEIARSLSGTDEIERAIAEKEAEFGSAPATQAVGTGRPRLAQDPIRVTAESYLRRQEHRTKGQSLYDAIAGDLVPLLGFTPTGNEIRGYIRAAERDGLLTKGVRGKRQRRPGPNLDTEGAEANNESHDRESR